jgi:hypothetical protein
VSSSNGISKDAFVNSGTAGNLEKSYTTQANNTASTLSPLLTKMATNPQGYAPQDMANMTTAAMQSYGGSQSGTVGQANLQAARSNNAGAYTGALDDSARANAAGLSDAALRVQNQNANVKLQQQQQGIAGLQNMYGTNVGAGENALGLSDQALQVANAGKQTAINGWMAPFQALSGLGQAAGSIMTGVNG